MVTPIYQAKLIDRVALSPTTIEVTFERLDKQTTPYIPGQFFKFGFEVDGEEVQRSFSVSTRSINPTENQNLHIAIASVKQGKASEFFFNSKLGSTVNVYGPYGQLLLPEQLPKRLLLIATGTGVAPYRSMIPQLQNHLLNASTEIHLVMGARYPGEMLYEDEFKKLSQDHADFYYHAQYSRELPKNPDSFAYKGYVQDAFTRIDPNKDSDLVYLCGNPMMVDDVYKLLKEQGFGVKSVRREKYVFAVR